MIFRLWSNGLPDVGDVVQNRDTGNRWLIDRAELSRTTNLRGYRQCWRLEVHRLASDEQPHPAARTFLFERFPDRRR